MKPYFICGTDTDCGKTYFTCQLLAYLNQRQSALALKPIASGCELQEGRLYNSDILSLQKYNPKQEQAINGWLFPSPLSPHLAAQEVGMQLSVKEIATFCAAERFAELDYLLIEGAGGLMVPLNAEETWLDFLKLTQIPLILVVGMRLGCLNHALLSEAVLKANQIKAAGWIANCMDKDMRCLEENIETLTAKMQMPLLATIPYGGKLTASFVL